MQFENEKELQQFIASTFAAMKDPTVVLEPETKRKHRLDVLTSQYAIEVKPVLTREAITQAAGQLVAYKEFYEDGKRQPVIAGLAPNGEAARVTSDNYVSVYAEQGIEVWYVDETQDFIDAYESFKHYGEVILQPEQVDVFSPAPRTYNPVWWPVLAGAALFVVMICTVFSPEQSIKLTLTGPNDEVVVTGIDGKDKKISVGTTVTRVSSDDRYTIIEFKNQRYEVRNIHLRKSDL